MKQTQIFTNTTTQHSNQFSKTKNGDGCWRQTTITSLHLRYGSEEEFMWQQKRQNPVEPYLIDTYLIDLINWHKHVPGEKKTIKWSARSKSVVHSISWHLMKQSICSSVGRWILYTLIFYLLLFDWISICYILMYINQFYQTKNMFFFLLFLTFFSPHSTLIRWADLLSIKRLS